MVASAPPTSTLSEHASKELLRAYGVPVAPERIVATAEQAGAAAADEVGLPAVVKLCGDAIAHKTERGLVRLNLRTADDVAAAAADLLALATPEDGAVELLVAPMLQASRELIAGLVRDPSFGMCVMVGIGGILAEAIADVAFGLVPLERRDAHAMIDALSNQALLGPFRGEPAVDREAVADVLCGLSDAAAADASIESADLNPLLVVDGRPVAVDALVERRL